VYGAVARWSSQELSHDYVVDAWCIDLSIEQCRHFENTLGNPQKNVTRGNNEKTKKGGGKSNILTLQNLQSKTRLAYHDDEGGRG